jgi:hypothetical protein
MSRLTLRLPESLHQQLVHLAEREQVSLNQCIVYLLTRQVTSAYTIQPIAEPDIAQQQQAFEVLLRNLGQVSSIEIDTILAERDQIEPEPELDSETIARLQKRIYESRKAKNLM